jgi:hypothetical protein
MAARAFLIVLLLAIGSARAQPPVTGAAVELASLRYIEIAPGTGVPAAPGKRYTVHYTGWLKDGTKFDSSVDRNQPLDFVQGRRQVIAGWDLGFEGMKVGGKRRLFIPYQLAYGEAGSGPIPARAELIFDVELLGVEDVPTVAPAVDVLLPLIDLETRVMALARAIPADKYSWKPAESAKSVAQVLMRIADSTKALLANNRTIPREDLVVPFAVKFIAGQLDIGHLGIGDLDARRIATLVNLGMDFESFPRRGSGDQTDDYLQAGKWLSAPVLTDKGEQAVFDFVPFACSRRKVAHGNGQSGLIGQPLQFQFPQAEAGPVTAAAIGGDE